MQFHFRRMNNGLLELSRESLSIFARHAGESRHLVVLME